MLFLSSKPLPKLSQICPFDTRERSTPKRRAYALYRLRLPALRIL
jgi:hypothetical protein